MPLNSEIANLMVQAGRDRAAGIAGAGDAWAHAVSQIGQQAGQLPQLIESQKQIADVQRARDARNALSEAMKDDVVPPIMQDGLKLRDINGISKYMASKGFGAEFVPAAQHLDSINQSMISFQQARLGVVQAGAKALLAMGPTPPPALVNDFLDQLDHNQVYAPDTVATYRNLVKEHPEATGELLRRIAGPQKLTSGTPGSVMRDESGQIVPGSQVPNKPEVVNGQLVQPDTGAAIGAPIPKQETPSEVAARAEIVRHNLATEAISKLTQGREAAAAAETRRHNLATEAANNPLAALTGGAGAGSPSAAGAQPPVLKGNDLLQSLPEGVQTTIKALAEGRMAFPAGFALKTPYWQSMLQLVGQYDPSFDAVNFNARSSTRKAFTSGREAQQVNALNTVLGHLDKLSDAAEALKNSDVPAVNAVTNFLSKNVLGSSKVTNFDTVKKAVADEVTRVWRQAGGSVEDIRTAQENLKASNSPEQLRGAIATYGELLHSKLESLQDQYKQGMGTDAVTLLRPESKQVLDKISARAVGASVPKSSGATTSAKVGDIKYLADGTKVQITFIDPKGNATVKKVP